MKKIKSYTGIWNVEKVLYAINDFNLPFPVTFTQITWFVITEFIIILFGDIPPLSMIEGAFLKYFGIPVALTWFMSQKTFDGKKPYSFLKSQITYALRPKITYAGKAVKLHKQILNERCVIEESQRYLRLEHEDKESYVSYFTVNAIVGELDFPSSEIFYFQQQQFTFPVDTSMNVEIVENRKALTTVRNKKKELKDLDNHAYQAGSETSSNVVDALDSVDELETDLDQSKESMYKLSYVIRVSAPDLDELKRRCDEVKDFYDDLNVKLVRPAGDMLGLHSEFLPASKRYINDYVQYVKSDFLAGLGFGATQQLGETTGIYMGYSVDTGRNVYLQPSLASQGVKGTVTNALASAFVGSLGGGKSFCNNLLVYYAVLFGGQALLLDPKSERGNWKETLPEIAHEINIVNLTSDKDNAVLKHQPMVEKYAREYGISEYVNVLLAIIQVESGGTAEDVMQSSESLGLPPNSLDTESSIKQGCKYFASLLSSCKNQGIDDLNVAIQSYNYGGGYVGYVAGKGKKHTFNLAENFAREKSGGKKVTYTNPIAVAKNGGWRYGYGNMFYVELVNQYLTVSQVSGELAQKVMNEALKYQGWKYVYGGSNPNTSFDCSGLTQWCYGKAGISLPRTAQAQYDATQHLPLSQAKSFAFFVMQVFQLKA